MGNQHWIGKFHEVKTYIALTNDIETLETDRENARKYLEETVLPHLSQNDILQYTPAIEKGIETIRSQIIYIKEDNPSVRNLQYNPLAFTKDHRDDSDLQFVLRINGRETFINLSLKIRKKGEKEIKGLKNMGAQSCLSSYFGLSDTNMLKICDDYKNETLPLPLFKLQEDKEPKCAIVKNMLRDEIYSQLSSIQTTEIEKIENAINTWAGDGGTWIVVCTCEPVSAFLVHFNAFNLKRITLKKSGHDSILLFWSEKDFRYNGRIRVKMEGSTKKGRRHGPIKVQFDITKIEKNPPNHQMEEFICPK